MAASAITAFLAGTARCAKYPPSSPIYAGGLSPAARRWITITAEPTPNPDSLMFFPDSRLVLGDGVRSKEFKNKFETTESPLAEALFKVRGVAEVLLASAHVTIRKSESADWESVQPRIEIVMSQFYASDIPVMKGSASSASGEQAAYEEGSLEAQIVELLEERIRPFVQQDGGDVEFHSFNADSGIVYLRMQGACSGCPKSGVTLQFGIKNLLEHYIPEVKEVMDVAEAEEVQVVE
mmetsp:Transcript_8402/g.19782  ORF Transcript_8402/g.19782 Transcript_8402/m.19782 type:complete len:237 (-) Transcript_8402:114-824(-)|eukprot:312196-Amphidinium_carterae.1